MAYTKKTWQKGEVIKATDLNNMEDGVEAVTQEVEAIEEHYDSVSGINITINGTPATIGSTAKGNIVLSSSASRNGVDYTTQVDKGWGKIVCGVAKSNGAKNYQIILGQVVPGNADYVQNLPYLADYFDQQYVMQSELESNASILAGGSAVLGNTSLVVGSYNVAKNNCNYILGQFCYTSEPICSAIGEGLIAGERDQFVVGVANDNKAGDLFEAGNGTLNTSTGAVSRSNAFRVTKTGSAIAQNSLGIEDGNGGVVTITAAQLQALLSNANPTCLVTMTYDSTNSRYVSDKTAAEVYAAYNAAKSVVFKFSDIGYVMWGGKAHAEAFCPNVRMLYNDNAAGVINDPKYIVDGYGPNDITLGIIAPTSADYFIMGIS